MEELNQIDKRIKDLEEHIPLWLNARGMGKNMAVRAYEEIKELKLKKEDLINGTNKYEIYKIEKKLTQLNSLKNSANLIKKIQYNNKIKKANKQLQLLKK